MAKSVENLSLLMIAASEKSPNLYYATKFLAPDAFLFFQIRGRRILMMSDLEVDRAKDQADVDEVISLSTFAKGVREKIGRAPGMIDIVKAFLGKHSVQEVLVPGDFPIEYADPLRKGGLKIAYKSE